MKKLIICLFSAILFFFVLLFPRQSFAGAKSGLLLWYTSLVPTLFPVMILSRLLVDTNLAYRMSLLIARPFSRLLGLSPYGVYALVTGFLCGCPMGAKVLADLRVRGQIQESEAVYLARFCNNVSPAFLCNFVVLGHLGSSALLAPTLCIALGAPVVYGLLTNPGYRKSCDGRPPSKNKAPARAINFAMVDASIMDSICSITKLGGYVTLFSVLSSMADILPGQTALIRAAAAAVTEVSGGIRCLAALLIPPRTKYLLMIAACVFGGFCCAAQSAQMLSDLGLSFRSYLCAKLAVTVIAVVMAACYLQL